MGKCCPLASVEPDLLACGTNVTHSMPRGSILEEKEINKIGDEGRNVCHLSGSDFRSPRTSFGKKHVELFFGLYGS